MTPDPVPPAPAPSETEIVTTEGPADAATAVIVVTFAASFTVMLVGVEFDADDPPWLELITAATTPAPETPPTRAPTASAAMSPTVVVRRARSAGVFSGLGALA